HERLQAAGREGDRPARPPGGEARRHHPAPRRRRRAVADHRGPPRSRKEAPGAPFQARDGAPADAGRSAAARAAAAALSERRLIPRPAGAQLRRGCSVTDRTRTTTRGGPPVKLIGAGYGRTGTMSLKAALERLGYGPCF